MSPTPTPTLTVPLIDGTRLVVPDSLNLISCYVLQEQQDWFEDEIKFVRRLLRPGQQVIDIGANYGVYALCSAAAVGPSGRVWAFEPASGTADLLAQGIAANGFTQVTLDRRGLSNASGSAQLSINANSELNELVRDNPTTGETETVHLTTLDECMASYAWAGIDFLKIDAEGEEARILAGGQRFLAELSPLVQYEVKAGTAFHIELVQAFAALGYVSYRLVPGLNLLVRFDIRAQPDGYLLNLFCCKPQRAARLAQQGLLLDSPLPMAAESDARRAALNHKFGAQQAYGWPQVLGGRPYGALLLPNWRAALAGRSHLAQDEALRWHAVSQDQTLAPADRFAALECSVLSLLTLCQQQPSAALLASLARVAQEYGARTLAVQALNQLFDLAAKTGQIDLSLPFLAPGLRFDSVDPRGALGPWMLAAILEELGRLASFSSYYSGAAELPRLLRIRDLGYGSAEMARRLDLVQRRFGPSA